MHRIFFNKINYYIILPSFRNLVNTAKNVNYSQTVTSVFNILRFIQSVLLFSLWSKTRTTYYISNWIYTTNHKRIAVNYFWFVILAGIVGMVLATIIRLEFAYPGVGVFAGDSIQYLTLASAHGVIMVFFMIMPLLFGAFANFLLPTQLGVHDVAFPRLNSAAFWFLPGGLLMLCQLVCVDRRYQRMNCFNIREIQSILKRKFFVDLLNAHEHRDLLNKTAIGLRFKTNSISSVNSNMFVFYNYGIDFNSKIKTNNYSVNFENDENAFFLKEDSFFFFLIKRVDFLFNSINNNLLVSAISAFNNYFSSGFEQSLGFGSFFKKLSQSSVSAQFSFSYIYNLYLNFLDDTENNLKNSLDYVFYVCCYFRSTFLLFFDALVLKFFEVYSLYNYIYYKIWSFFFFLMPEFFFLKFYVTIEVLNFFYTGKFDYVFLKEKFYHIREITSDIRTKINFNFFKTNIKTVFEGIFLFFSKILKSIFDLFYLIKDSSFQILESLYFDCRMLGYSVTSGSGALNSTNVYPLIRAFNALRFDLFSDKNSFSANFFFL